MVTGKKAFEGEGQASLISAIMTADPPAMSTLQSMTPPALDHVVTTCLAKKPDDRWQSAGDVGRHLQWITEGGSQPSLASSVAAAPQRAGWRQAVPIAAAAVAVTALIVSVSVWSLMRPEPRPLTQFVLLTPPDGPVRAVGTDSEVAISPDGTRVVYASGRGGPQNRQLYLRKVGELDATPLRGAEGGNAPFFSPDGQSVGFRTSFGDIISLKKVSVLGGPAVPIVETDTSMRGTSWGPDDTIVFGTLSGGLMRVPAAGGEPEVLTIVDADQGETDHRWPDILPNLKGILFTAWSGSDEGSRLAVVSLETGAVSYLLPGGSFPRYTPTGHIVYGVGGTLRAVGFDADRLELTSTNAIPVVEKVATGVSSGAGNFSVSANGSLVYVRDAGTGVSVQRALVWVDRAGSEEALQSPLLAYQRPRVSPDGTRVAVDVADPEGVDIWIHDLARGTETRLTTDPADDRAPLWTPGGDRVVFYSDREGQAALFWKLVDAPGDAERLVSASEGRLDIQADAWSADGQTLLFWRAGGGFQPDIGLLSIEGERASEMLLDTQFREGGPAVSPDGRWIAYHGDETGQNEVYVQRFPELGGKLTVSTDGGQQPLWSPDGQELFYRGPGGMMVVPVETDPTFSAGAPEVLFDQQYYFTGTRRTYDLAPDGRFLMVKDSAVGDDAEGPAAQIILVQNWFEELKRLVPVE